ncbi:hypothetical protein B0A48_18747 [Cryoendolithus antarcticus]|uniref:MalT-like TPR region domain-containing protein n=1 Tax=Cryoendolithus antarcticus TaxID=1507870 RepID=A0A1V8S856_9PEZI|nr:hypothetical protein B0A48_18747 [Cryoendolithus antarcticus]
MLGHFNLSLAENAIMQNDYKLAEDRVMQADLSELTVDGNFEKAKEALEPCLQYFEHLPKDKIHYVVRQLADVLIELGNPEEAMALLQKHLSKLHAQGKMDTIAYNRLSLSFADAEILLGQHEAAQTRLEKVKHWFDLHSPANHTEQLDHVRALIASMRIAVRDMEWEMVQEHSEKALHLASEYSSFSPNNYHKGYIYQARVASHAQIARMHLERAASDAETVGTQFESAITHTQVAITHFRGANADLREAERCAQSHGHFMPGIGTYDRLPRG